MILTVTPNPSVDYLYKLDKLDINFTNRIQEVVKMTGGKGINAARVATILGEKTIATGILAGNNGKFIHESLQNEHIANNFVVIEGESRNCMTILHDHNKKTELNEPGPQIARQDTEELTEKVLQLCQKNKIDYVSLSGNLNTENKSFYAELFKKIEEQLPTIKIIVDTSGVALKKILKTCSPFFIKPNLEELEELLEVSIPLTEESIIAQLKKPIFDRTEGILVSLGEHGAIAKYDNHFYRLKIPKINVVSAEGSGDATVGGLLAALNKHLSIEEVFQYAMACGIANAMEEKTGFVRKENVEKIIQNVKIQSIIPFQK